jgi:ParB family chromosome partitioning protein
MQSIRQKGLLQPILVRRTDDYFEIVAGHRRFEACKRLRWKKIPSCISELTDKEAFEVALTENIQRKSLNPIEEADAFARYVKEYGWGGISELATRIGKSQEYISQRIFLLSLPEAVRKKIITRQLSPSAARELVWLKEGEEQTRLAEMIVENKIPTRTVRYMVKTTRLQKEISIEDEQLTTTEPAFENYNQTTEQNDPALKTIAKTILALRICLLRLDSILSSMNQRSTLREFIMEQRRSVHGLIDDAVKFKMGLKQRPIIREGN